MQINPLPRRTFLALTTPALFPVIAATLAAPLGAFGKGDFWNQKQPSEWSEEEVQRLLTKSPWAKEAMVSIDPSAMRGGMTRSREGDETPKGGGMTIVNPGNTDQRGGPPPGSPGVLGPNDPPPAGRMELASLKVEVRWESATPLREALHVPAQTGEPSDYIVSINGFPAPGHKSGRLTAEDRAQMLEAVREDASLQVKGKPVLHPYEVRRKDPANASNLLLFFRRADQPISIDDKEVTLVMKSGAVLMRTKFALKEMTYRGKLAI